MFRRSAPSAAAILTFLSLSACGGSPTAADDGPGAPADPSAPDASPSDDAAGERDAGDPPVIEGQGDAPDASDGGDLDGDAPVIEAGPPPCPATSLPTANLCVVSEAYGVFVAANAAAGGDGSRGKPFTTVTAGVAAAKAAGKRVYVCAGTYPEALEIQNGVSMFGYFACVANTWTIGTQHARLQSPTSPAARAVGVTTATRIEGIDVFAPDFGGLAADATQSAKSSIGLLTSNAAGLTFAAATVHAGTAQPGGRGSDGQAVTQASATIKGGEATPVGVACLNVLGRVSCFSAGTNDDSGPSGGVSDCRLPGASSANPSLSGGDGGRGGHAARWAYVTLPDPSRPGSTYQFWNQSVAPGSGLPIVATNATAAGGQPGRANAGTSGQNGAARASGPNGASATTIGALGPSGFTTSDGSNAGNGVPGQGGGGGGGYLNTSAETEAARQGQSFSGSASGSGGGAGGCAGVGGTAGRGGGSSIAAIALNGAMALEGVVFETSGAGAAGRGGAGSAGTAGGAGGGPSTQNPGGAGSAGSAGGAGGSGRGGHSIAVAYTGTAPTLTNPTYRLGAAGAGAPSFTSATGTIPASQPGVQAPLQKF